MAELDRSTIERAQQGDRRAQEALLLRYVRPLHAFLRRAGPGGDVDDWTQELLSKLLKVLPQFDPSGPAQLTTWVFTIAHRWLLDEKRRRHLSVAPLDEASEIADPTPSASEQVEREQLSAKVQAAIARLPEAQRRVFVLAFVHQQPIDAVAQVEGVPVGTIKSRLHRARAQLTQWLRPLADEEGEGHGLSRRA